MTKVTITGTPREGYTLTATVDPATTGTFSWEDATGAATAGNTYVAQVSDAGEEIEAIFEYEEDGRTKEAKDTVRILPLEENNEDGDFHVSGFNNPDPIEIRTSNGQWDDVLERDNFASSAKTYSWYLDGVVVAGETSDTYAYDASAVGKDVSLRIDYVDGLGRARFVTSRPERIRR